MKWEQLRNGALMSVAGEAGFEVFVTIDKQIKHQQNLAALALAVVVVDGKSNALPSLLPFTSTLRNLFASSLERVLYVVEEGGSVLKLSSTEDSTDQNSNCVLNLKRRPPIVSYGVNHCKPYPVFCDRIALPLSTL